MFNTHNTCVATSGSEIAGRGVPYHTETKRNQDVSQAPFLGKDSRHGRFVLGARKQARLWEQESSLLTWEAPESPGTQPFRRTCQKLKLKLEFSPLAQEHGVGRSDPQREAQRRAREAEEVQTREGRPLSLAAHPHPLLGLCIHAVSQAELSPSPGLSHWEMRKGSLRTPFYRA